MGEMGGSPPITGCAQVLSHGPSLTAKASKPLTDFYAHSELKGKELMRRFFLKTNGVKSCRIQCVRGKHTRTEQQAPVHKWQGTDQSRPAKSPARERSERSEGMGYSWTSKRMPSAGMWIQMGTGRFLPALDLGVPTGL